MYDIDRYCAVVACLTRVPLNRKKTLRYINTYHSWNNLCLDSERMWLYKAFDIPLFCFNLTFKTVYGFVQELDLHFLPFNSI